MKISIILPCKNELESLKTLLPQLQTIQPEAEIILVNDGSSDGSGEFSESIGIKTINHAYSMGNGAAIKSGARAATGNILIFMDADGQHKPEDITQLLQPLSQGYSMVVGCRDKSSQASIGRWLANSFYNYLASWITEQKIEDLTSGFRAVEAEKFKEFLYLLPNSFSYPTTITMAFFRSGYPVGYVPIKVHQRIGKSHIHLIKDGIRFLLIIFKIGTLYSPLKLFLPISVFFFIAGISYYLFTFITHHAFTNMGALLFTTSVIIFLIGLVSEQITNLSYHNTKLK